MIKNLFLKDVARTIDGVIKADKLSDKVIKQEVEEYVITNELEKRFSHFFETYSKNLEGLNQNNGVWISGFFGSGKSHLLKILSYVLENRNVGGIKIGEKFSEKIKKIEDFELENNIKKAINTPCETILFNIDQKSDSDIHNKNLLNVFVKVFNEHRGYYSKIPYIAQLEKDLDKQNIFEKFKQRFYEISNSSWENSRDTILLDIEDFAKALSDVKNISYENAEKLIDKYEQNYSVSIEDFAKEVDEYIKTKPENFRLFFLVDEIGQYIGNNTDLMLNLQTIIESLSTITNSKAWLIVTSQETLEDLVGEHTKKTSNDFSKILGRFDVKMNLTSANVNEVIKKRLLYKNESAKKQLQNMFADIENSLRSKIYFEKGMQYKSYINAEDFADIYPFIPYQFGLLKDSLIGLSRNSAFQGAHQSVGERSMLQIFQEILVRDIAHKEIGALVSYDTFYAGLEATIKSGIQAAIKRAEEHLDDDFSIKVLKALFLVKYVKEFVPTLSNITTLMIDDCEQDISTLKQNVKKSLDILENNIFIQRNGENYEFLTDIEQDIENEIKSTDIEQSEITRKLYEWLYDDIIKIAKVRHKDNGYDYAFNRKMDDNILRAKTASQDLSLNILTPFYDISDRGKIIAKSIAESDIILLLPDNFNIIKELELYIKTEKFIPKKQSLSISEQERSILEAKGRMNNSRRKNILEKLQQMIEESIIYFQGKELNISSSNIKTKIEEALNIAIETIYPNLAMLKRIYKEEDVKEIISKGLNIDDTPLDESENEVLNYITRQLSSYKKVTIGNIHEYFSSKPYGWYPHAVNAILSLLYTKNLIELMQQGDVLDKKRAIEALNKTNQYSSTFIMATKRVDKEQLEGIKRLFSEILPDINVDGKVKDIYDNSIIGLKKEFERFVMLADQYRQYTFYDKLDFVGNIYKEASSLSYDNFFDKILDMEDDFLDAKEDIIEPLVVDFLQTDRIKIYENILDYFDKKRDIILEVSSECFDIFDKLKQSKTPYRGKLLVEAKQCYEKLKIKIEELLKKEKEEILLKIDNYIEKILNDETYKSLYQEKGKEQKSLVMQPFKSLKASIENSDNIFYIRDKKNALKDLYKTALEKIEELQAKNEGNKTVTKPKKTSIKYLMPRKSLLTNKDDVELFIKELKREMLKAIEEQKQIEIEGLL